MLEFCHAVTGAVIATKISNPLISLPLCFASHFITDFFPHWNPHIFTEKKKFGKLRPATILFILGDSFLGLILGLWIASSSLPNVGRTLTVLFGSFFAVSGDLIEAPFYFFNWQNKYLKKLINFQRDHQWNVSFWPGIIFQTIYTLLFLFIAGKI